MCCFSHTNILATLKIDSDMCFKETEQKSPFDLHKTIKEQNLRLRIAQPNIFLMKKNNLLEINNAYHKQIYQFNLFVILCVYVSVS